jgi:hypothetical protein
MSFYFACTFGLRSIIMLFSSDPTGTFPCSAPPPALSSACCNALSLDSPSLLYQKPRPTTTP